MRLAQVSLLFWASWADCLSIVYDRHPDVATMMVGQLSGVDDCESPSLQAASRAARELTGVEGFDVPSLEALVRGARPPLHDVDDHEAGEARHGWQHEAASRVERIFRSHLMERFAEHEQALLRSQSGPMAGMALSASPSNFFTRIEPHLFTVVLLRRLRRPLPFSVRMCRCGRLLDSLGHHRAACARAGVLGRREICNCNRECCHSIVPRRRRQSGDERHASRLGLSSACCTRGAEVGDHRGRSPIVRRRPLWTPHWSPRCTAMAQRAQVLLTQMELFWQWLGGGRGGTYTELIGRNARARLVCLRVRSEVGGPVKRTHSCVCWPRPKQERSPPSCDVVWSKRGACGGDLSWRVLQQGLLLRPFWIFAPVGWTEMCRQPTRW